VYFALVAYRDEAAHGVETTAIDLISDLFHLANQEAWDMEKSSAWRGCTSNWKQNRKIRIQTTS
jgi:hypothetical protein